jgi:pseudouridine-5'-phosphate glycosidase|tara:strand:+ start:431 stop:703 length:273 start_codon:yes stop_codon:yes gene_type:complete
MYLRENSYFKEFLNTIQENTEQNLHSENCMLIAVNFGKETQKEEMKELIDDHNKQKELKSITSTARKYLIKDILNNIERKSLSTAIRKRL